jgi:HSP20 family protein
MTEIVRWDPFAELEQMRRSMDRVFGEFRPYRLAADIGTEFGYVPLDVTEADDHFEVKASLPGVKPEEVDVQVHGDVVTIKGETKAETEEKEKNWLRRERRYGAFARTFKLPTEIDAKKAKADFEDGVLVLTLPKSETARPKSIKVGKSAMIEGEKA